MSDFKITEELKNEIKAELREEVKKELVQELREEIKKEIEADLKVSKDTDNKQADVFEAVKTEETKVEEVKSEEVKAEETKTEEVKSEEVKAEEVKSEEVKTEEAKTEEAKTEENKVEESKTEEAKVEEVKVETSDKKITFKKGLIIYVIIWLIVTLLVCLYLWKSMSGYQKNYDAAKEAANPDKVAAVCIEKFKSDNIADVVREQYPELSPYESDSSLQTYFKSVYDESSLSYNRVENFSETNPEYQVIAGDKIVGSFKLVEVGDADKYGFHNYDIKSTELAIELPEFKSYKIDVLNGDQVIVNGVDITTTETAKVEKVSDSVQDIIAENTGKSFEKAEYELSGFVSEPVVNVISNGNECQIEAAEDEFKYYAAYDINLLNDVQDRILTADKTYIQVMNLVSQFAVYSGYLVPGGNAYKAVMSAMSGLSWAGAPEQFEITDAEIKEMWQYDDNNFVVVSHYALHRVYRGETYDEEMTIENLYTKINGVWLIQEMAFKR